MVDELMRFCGAEMRFLTSDSFQEIHTTVEPEAIMAACNSTLCQLSANVLGRTNFGGGLLKMQTYELRELLVPDPRVLGEEVSGLIRGAGLLSLGEPGRRILDDIVFDAVGLTIGEREAVCEAVASLVAGRITKARSLS
jgi:hypothetical protein